MSSIVSMRTDGFGQRLKVLLFAMRVSKYFDLDMKFVWDRKGGAYGKYHACEEADQTFSSDFLSMHYLEDTPEGVGFNPSKFKEADYFLNDTCYLVNWFSDSLNHLGGYEREFFSVGFSDVIKSAISAANKISIDSPSSAVHLRGGDILYGPLRCFSTLFQDKIIPISIAKELVSDKSVTWFVFAQDESVSSHLRGFDNVVVSSDLQGDFLTSVEKVIFDIVLMSRCDRIFGGSSAVCELASLISGVKVIGVSDLYSDDKINSSIKNDELFMNSLYDKYLMSQLFSAVYYYESDLLLRANSIVESGKFDLENFSLPILSALALYRVGKFSDAEGQLNKLLFPAEHLDQEKVKCFVLDAKKYFSDRNFPMRFFPTEDVNFSDLCSYPLLGLLVGYGVSHLHADFEFHVIFELLELDSDEYRFVFEEMKLGLATK